MTRRLLVLLFLFAVASAARANDRSLVGVGGSWKVLAGEHSSVRMVNETVRVDIGRKTFDVKATFVFRNEGPPVVVHMGFPERGLGDIPGLAYKNRSAYTRFRTAVDGQQAPARRVFVEGDENSYLAHWVKEVHFNQGQQRVVTVSYTAPVGTSVDGRMVAYHFTGSTWKGNVAYSVLDVVSHVKGEDTLVPGATEPTRILRPGHWVYERRDWQAEEAVTVQMARKP